MKARRPAQAAKEAPAKPEASKPEPNVFWQCEAAPLPGSAPLDQLTVGTKFLLNCSGPEISAWQGLPQIQTAKEDEAFSLVVLEVKTASAAGAQMVVTSYKPGQHKPEFIDIGQGSNWVRVRELTWTTSSVVKQEQGQPPPQPYPPFGPFRLLWPWWLWVGLAFVLILAGTYSYFRIKRRRERKALLESLQLKGTALTPYAQFHKELRQLLRRYQGQKEDAENRPEDYLAQLDESFRLYLSRELLVPAVKWPDRAIVGDLKKRHYRLYRRTGSELSGLLRELRRARGAGQISFADCEQLQEMSRRIAENIRVSREQRT